MKKNLIVIIALVVAVLLSGANLFYFMRGNHAEPPEEPPLASEEHYDYAIAESFVTNVKDSNRLLKTTLVLVSDKEGQEEFWEEHHYEVRDTILFILRDLTEADIRRLDIQDELRDSIPMAINQALEIQDVVSVRFSDFVMQ